ncbi:MAG: RHS repeat-associated core domain-containing protein, partial [Flammeovirgaceae bacterium]
MKNVKQFFSFPKNPPSLWSGAMGNRFRMLLSMLVVVILSLSFDQPTVQAQTHYTWTGSSSSDWGTANNWSPTGVPSTADTVTIGSTTHQPQLDQARTVARLKMTAGSALNFNATILTVQHILEISDANLSNGKLVINNAIDGYYVYTHMTRTIADVEIEATLGNFHSHRSTFKQPFKLTYETPAQNSSSGGINLYQSVFEQDAAFIQNHNVDELDIDRATFNQNLTLTTNSTRPIRVGYSGSVTLKQGTEINSLGDGGMLFKGLHLAANQSIRNGNLGFTKGTLGFDNCLIESPLNFTSSGNVRGFWKGNTFNNQVDMTIPSSSVFYNNVFNDSTKLIIGGTSFGNTFNGPLEVITSSGITFSANIGDSFNHHVTFRTVGSNRITLSSGEAKSTFTGNIYIDNASGNIQNTSNLGGIIFSGTGDQIIGLPPHETLTNRPFYTKITEINKPSGRVIIQTPVEFDGKLTFTQGGLFNDGSELILGRNSTYVGAGSANHNYIEGKVKLVINQSVRYDVPLGLAGNYRPFQVNGYGGSQAVELEYVAATPPANPTTGCVRLSNCEYWRLTPVQGFLFQFSVGLATPEACDLPSSPEIAHYTGSEWVIRDSRVDNEWITGRSRETGLSTGQDYYYTFGTSSIGTVSGPSLICQQATASYEITGDGTTSNYQWTVPTGFTITSGQGTNQITVTTDATATSGNIEVNVPNGACDAATYAVTLNELPADAGNISGLTTVCPNAQGVTYTVPAISGADAYVWMLPHHTAQAGTGATGTVETTQHSIEIDFSSHFSGGAISVSGKSTQCGTGNPSTLAIQLNTSLTATLAVKKQPACQGGEGEVEITTNGAYYTLYQNGNPYAGQVDVPVPAATFSIQNLAEGTYHVVIKDANGCTVESDALRLRAEKKLVWSQQVGGTGGYDFAVSTIDATGNVYVGGNYTQPITLGEGNHQVTLTHSGDVDMFWAKYSPEGALIWAKKATGPQKEYVNDLHTDANGNLYITGFYGTNVDFDGRAVSSSNGTDMFVAKYDTNGNLVWMKAGTGTSAIQGKGVRADAAGNVFVSGWFYNDITFDGVNRINASNWQSDVFLAKYDAQGNFLWAQTGGTIGVDYGFRMEVDAQGNAYIVGSYTAGANFSGQTLTTQVAGKRDAFVAKYDENGNLKWIKTHGSPNDDYLNAIAIDAQGNVYLGAHYANTVTVGNQVLTAPSGTTNDLLLIKYDTFGNLIWAQNGNSTGNSGVNALTVAPSGELYIAGWHSGVATIGGQTIDHQTGQVMYVAQLQADGTVSTIHQTVQLSAAGGFYTLNVDADENFIVSGDFTSQIDLDQTTSISSLGGVDGYVAKYGNQQAPSLSGITGATSVCRNKAEQYTVSGISGAEKYQWTLPNGATSTSGTTIATAPNVIVETNDAQITLSFSPTASNGQLAVVGVNACGQSDRATLAINVIDQANIQSIEGNTLVCMDSQSQTATYRAIADAGIMAFRWEVRPSTILDVNAPATESGIALTPISWTDSLAVFQTTSDQVEFRFNDIGTYINAITVSDTTTACGDVGTSATLNLILHPNPAAELWLADKLSCSATDVTAKLILKTNQAQVTTYEVYKVGQVNPILIGNATVNGQETLDTLGAFPYGEYYVKVIDQQGCQVTTEQLKIEPDKRSDGTIIVDQSVTLDRLSTQVVCQGKAVGVWFQTQCLFGNEYFAQIQVGNDTLTLGSVTGAGNLMITAAFPATVPVGTYPIWVVSSSGISSTSKLIRVEPNPDFIGDIGSIQGDDLACLHQDELYTYTLGTAPVAGVDEYHWTIGGNTYITTTHTFQYRFYQQHTAAESPLTLKVFLKDSCGVSLETTKTITLLEGLPTKGSTTGGIYCENTGFTLVSQGITGATSYVWDLSALPDKLRITASSGSWSNGKNYVTTTPYINLMITNDDVVDITFPIKVSGTNHCGSGADSDEVLLTIKWTPDVNLAVDQGYTSCYDAKDGSLTASTNATVGTYTLEKFRNDGTWHPYTNNSGRNFTNVAFDATTGNPFPSAFENLGIGSYRIALTPPNACVAYSPISTIQDGSPHPTLSCLSALPCEGAWNGKMEFAINYLGQPANFAGSYTYQIVRQSDQALITSGVFQDQSGSITIDHIPTVEPEVYYEFVVAANLQGSDPTCTTCTDPYCEVRRVFSFAKPAPAIALHNYKLKDDRTTKAYFLCVAASGAKVPYTLSATVNSCSQPFENYRVILSDTSGNTISDQFYNFSGTQIGTTAVFDSLDVGAYSLKFIAGANNYQCETEEVFEVIRLDEIEVKLKTTDETCTDANDGTVQALVSAAAGGVEYKWFSRVDSLSPWEEMVDNYQGSYIVGLAPGDYRMEFRLADYDRNCTDVYQEFQIKEHEPSIDSVDLPQNTLPAGKPNCDPMIDARLAENHVQGVYQFVWYRCTGDTCQNTAAFDQVFSEGLQSTTASAERMLRSNLDPQAFEDSSYYYVEVIDPNGCVYPSDAVFLVKPALERTYEISISWDVPTPTPQDTTRRKNTTFGLQASWAAYTMRNVANDCILEKEMVAGLPIRESCLTPQNINDELTVACNKRLYHYTLYYYDRSGALTKTVPPEGVRYLDKNQDLGGKWRRIQGVRPDHKLVTTYNYNNLGQLISQNTPDGNDTKFIYNSIGQLRYTQNARQAGDATYSYTIYDRLGRPIEAGESATPGPNFAFALIQDNDALADDMSFPNVFDENEQQVITVYSEAAPTDKQVFYCTEKQGQRYLQNRVSYTYTYNKGEKEKGVYAYYSYDPHGNVEWIIQDIPGFGRSSIAYEYDLVSSKVLKVRYNECRPDQYYHKYEYDEDDRIVAVYTSRDNHIWDKDANYDYYAHGPLQRSELGEDAIQACDYVYTIHGWIKGVNGPDATHDIGGDGQAGSRFAADEFGMTLGYYEGDYKNKIGGQASVFESTLNNIHYMQPKQNLYNGNISTWASHMNQQNPTLMHYQYDKLNRIKTSERHQWNTTGNAWEMAGNGNVYRTAYTYDGNGNIDSLVRYDAKGEMLDNLKYVYEEEYNGEKLTNKLKKVIEHAPLTAYDKDIENTTHDTEYVYDEIGNLIEDRRDSIAIEWNVQDKVHKVKPLFGAKRPVIRYYYDVAGNRVAKEVDKGTTEYADPALIRTTYYVRDADGNIMSTYERRNVLSNEGAGIYTAQYRQKEVMLYGSERLGMYQSDSLINEQLFSTADFDGVKVKFFEEGYTQTAYKNPLIPAVTLQKANGGNMAMAEAASEQIDLYAVVDQNHWGQSDVVFIYDQQGDLWIDQDTTPILAEGANQSIFVRRTEDRFATTRYYDYFTVHQGSIYKHQFKVDDVTGIELLTKNEVFAAGDALNRYGGALAAQLNLEEEKLYLYGSKYNALTHDNTLTAWAVSKDGSVQQFNMATQSATYHTNKGDIQLAPDGQSLVWYQLGSKQGFFSARAAQPTQYQLNPDLISISSSLPLSVANDAYTYYASTDIHHTGDVFYTKDGLTETAVHQVDGNTLKELGKSTVAVSGDIRRTANQQLMALEGATQITWDTQGQKTRTTLTELAVNALPLQTRYFRGKEAETTALNLTRSVGKKQYELKDHLGNVRVVVADAKTAVLNQDSTQIDSLKATVLAYNNYYPFGMEMPEGTYQNTSYRFGFNSKENDREWGTGGLTQDYGFRLYNPVLAKFLSVDPLAPSYPWYTPYQFAGNMPIWAIDLDGLEPKYKPTAEEVRRWAPAFWSPGPDEKGKAGYYMAVEGGWKAVPNGPSWRGIKTTRRGQVEYTVKPGDSPIKIAKMHHTTVEAIKDANP